jgi:hypothetical protein
MTELELLHRLQTDTNLIGARADKDEQRQRHAEFTRRAAWALQPYGYGNVRKTSGENVRGLSIDKIIHKSAGSVVDLIADSDGANPQLAWNVVDHLDPAAFFVEPQPEPGPAPPLPPPAPPAPSPDEAIFAQLEKLLLESTERIVDGLDGMVQAVGHLSDSLDALQQNGVKVHIVP